MKGESPTKAAPWQGERDDLFWRRHPGILWSNAHASNETMIANALLRPNFHLLLDIALWFDLDRLQESWKTLSADPGSETKRVKAVAPIVERCLAQITGGFDLCTVRNW